MTGVEQDPRFPGLRVLTAPNPGLFTLSGTRTHVVGVREVAVVDPGPDAAEHLDRLAAMVEDAERVQVLLTHHHRDHAGGVPGLMERLGPRGELADDARTDAGTLARTPAPGHSRDHVVFHWPAASAVFVGDVLLGQGDTTWLGEYRECVTDYFASLDRIDALGARYLISAHGPVIDDPAAAIQRYRAHRLARIDQVREALATAPGARAEELADAIYALAPGALRTAARQGVEAMLVYLEEERS